MFLGFHGIPTKEDHRTSQTASRPAGAGGNGRVCLVHASVYVHDVLTDIVFCEVYIIANEMLLS